MWRNRVKNKRKYNSKIQLCSSASCPFLVQVLFSKLQIKTFSMLSESNKNIIYLIKFIKTLTWKIDVCLKSFVLQNPSIYSFLDPNCALIRSGCFLAEPSCERYILCLQINFRYLEKYHFHTLKSICYL